MGDNLLHLISEDGLSAANGVFQLETSVMEALLAAARIVRNDAGLIRLLMKLRDRVMSAGEESVAAIADDIGSMLLEQDSLLRTAMGRASGMFAVLGAVAVLPGTIDRYRSRGIPNHILVDTMSDLSIWMRHYFAGHGEWGLDNIGWMLNHLCGRLYRLGRLQFCLANFNYPALFIRNKHNGEVAALSEADVVYRNDGRVDGTNRIYDSERAWTSQLRLTEESFVGNPFRSCGFALRETASLPRDNWRVALRQGESVLDIHIPEGGSMTRELCSDSMLQAISFYREYYPERSFKAFVCTSWLLDPQLQSILPADSNIVTFQRQFYLLPLRSDEDETYKRVFGTTTIDPDSAKRDTGLRRAILDYVAGGNHLHAAAGVLLKEDLPQGMIRAY